MFSLKKLYFDIIVVGAGGAGLSTALQLSKYGANIAVMSKVFPTRSHTVSAQGGITCAIASNDENDDWRWHMYDTIKGSDYLGDQDAIEYMCSVGPQALYELEHMGLPFSRNPNGRIYQRPFGGQSKNYGKGGQAARTCAAADRTGHALLHTLFQANLKYNTIFLNEWYAIDLVKNQDNIIVGLIAICIETGDMHYIRSKAVVLATGGAGRIYASTTNALINTGDGIGMALRAGIPVQDIEMWQFHPTGIFGVGILITEASRGEGGYLINNSGERFMARYAPITQDLASRDVVSRSIMKEILANNGCGPYKNYVELKLNHLGEDIIKKRLPGICDLSKTFAHIDPIMYPIPVIPTCHYMMGGICTNIFGQVFSQNCGANNDDILIEGLFAVGEVACVSVHGANRLGGNSLLDLIVFGRSTGKFLVEKYIKNVTEVREASKTDIERSIHRFFKLNEYTDGENIYVLKKELQNCMQQYFGVFRTSKYMQKGIIKLASLKERIYNIYITDKSKSFNLSRIEALELQNLIEVAEATSISAEYRKESRGAHSREDFPQRDDTNWLYHTIYHPISKKVTKRSINFSPKHVSPFNPVIRTY